MPRRFLIFHSKADLSGVVGLTPRGEKSEENRQHPCITRLRGEISKIAKVTFMLLPIQTPMKNFKSPACLVWAGDGGEYEKGG